MRINTRRVYHRRGHPKGLGPSTKKEEAILRHNYLAKRLHVSARYIKLFKFVSFA